MKDSEYEDELNDLGLESTDIGNDERAQVRFESPSKNSNVSEEERLHMALKQIAQLEEELNDFKQSSYELEEELEKELNELETKNLDLEDKVASKQKEIENWKKKYVDLEQEFNSLSSKNEEKFRTYKKELQSVRSKLVNIEILNDNIEQNERILSINLNDLETKYNDSLEKIALIESEINYKDELVSKEKLNHQNTKNQLTEVQTELKKVKEQLAQRQNTPPAEQGQNSRKNSFSSFVGGISLSELTKNMPKSNSMKQLHNMIEQTKFMENRVESIRNTIRPSKMRKVSGKNVKAQPVDHNSDTSYVEASSEYDITNTSSLANSSLDDSTATYFTTLSKSTTNDSLNHTKAKNRIRKLNLQKPPIQPLASREFSNHWSNGSSGSSATTTIKMVSPLGLSSTPAPSIKGSAGVKKNFGSHRHLSELETIRGSPNNNKVKNVLGSPKTLDPKRSGDHGKAAEVKKLFQSPKNKPRRKNGILPSLRKFNIN